MTDGYYRQFDLGKMESDPSYIAELFHQFDIPRESCIQCIVKAYDAKRNTVDLQPLPDHTRELIDKDEKIPRGLVKDVPVVAFAHGGFVIKDDIFIGDTGYLFAADRNCDKIVAKNSTVLYKDDGKNEKNKGNDVPDDYSLALFSNGFFVPCSWADRDIPEDEEGRFVIKGIGKEEGDDNWCRLILSNDGKITLDTSGSGVIIDKENGVKVWKRLSVDGDRRKAVIDPDADLDQTDAKFRLVSVLVGMKERVGSVYRFFAKKMRVLVDEPEEDLDNITEIDVGVTQIIAGENITIDPQTGTGAVTINANGTGGGTTSKPLHLQYSNGDIVTFDGSVEKSFNVPTPPVTSVAKEGSVARGYGEQPTYGISVYPETGDVKIENTGVTGAKIAQSSSGSPPYYFQLDGTDAIHEADTVKTKDVTLTAPILQKLATTEDGDYLIDCLSIQNGQQTGSVESGTAVQPMVLKIDRDKAATKSLKVNNVEQAKFLGTADVNIESGGGKIEITGTAPVSISDIGFITAIQYNITDHKFQIKGRGIGTTTESSKTYVTSITPESNWIDMTGGECAPHSSET